MKFIRPLIYTKEIHVDAVSKQLNLPIVKNNCPNEKKTERQEIKEYLHEIYKKKPQAHDNFMKMLSNTECLSLWEK